MRGLRTAHIHQHTETHTCAMAHKPTIITPLTHTHMHTHRWTLKSWQIDTHMQAYSHIDSYIQSNWLFKSSHIIRQTSVTQACTQWHTPHHIQILLCNNTRSHLHMPPYSHALETCHIHTHTQTHTCMYTQTESPSDIHRYIYMEKKTRQAITPYIYTHVHTLTHSNTQADWAKPFHIH